MSEIVAPGGVAALAGNPRNEAAPRSIAPRRSMVLRTVRGEITCRDSDNHVVECWCVTSYMECSAREYSRSSIISNSDISPSNTMEVSVHLRAAPRELRNAGAGVALQNKPDVPGFPGSRSF